jgi:hypothetical protein
MTATYSGDPSASSEDWVRDKIGDVDSDAFFLQDEEISSEIADHGNLYIAAANCCYKIITRLGEYDRLAAMFQKRGDILLKTATKKQGFTSVIPSVGVITDAGTQPNGYAVSGEKEADWSLNEADRPSRIRGVDI